MENILQIVFILLLLGFTVVVVFAGFLLKKSKKSFPKLTLDELTLIVPFRDEKKRILPLIQALNAQKKLPKAIYFIDDHSTDKTTEFIQANLNDLSCEVLYLKLPDVQKGKKEAVFYAVNHAKTKYVHTMDADVFFDECFFNRIENLSASDLLVLPVNLVGNGFFGSLFTLEYCSFQLMQLAFGKQKPLTASGANLIVDRKNYLTHNNIEKHKSFASGDDQFVLNAFLKANLQIQTVLGNHFSVKTPVPNNLKSLFQQRLRWMSKNNVTFMWKTFLISLWVFATQLLFILSFILLLIKGLYVQLLFLFMLKILIEMLQFTPILKLRKLSYLNGLMPILSLFYPFYLLTLFVLSFFYQPTWKGRIIKQKNKSTQIWADL